MIGVKKKVTEVLSKLYKLFYERCLLSRHSEIYIELFTFLMKHSMRKSQKIPFFSDLHLKKKKYRQSTLVLIRGLFDAYQNPPVDLNEPETHCIIIK